MRGVLENPLEVESILHIQKDRFGNYLPIPHVAIMSMIFSFATLIRAAIKFNTSLVYLEENVKIKHKPPLKQMLKTLLTLKLPHILACLPFFICSTLFRILCFAYLGIFLHYKSLLPTLTIFFINIIIGYYFLNKSKLPPKICKRLAANNGGQEYKTEMAVWLNGFLGTFIPCCYLQKIHTNLMNKLRMQDQKKIIKINKNIRSKFLKYQEISVVTILLISESIAEMYPVNYYFFIL